MNFLLAREVGADNRSWAQLHVSTGGVVENGGKKFEVTSEDIAAYAAFIKANPDRIPIDYDHSYAEGSGTRAAGWIDASTVEVRNGDELWAMVEWTPAAAQAIRDGEYRYISPEFSFKERKDGVLRKAAEFLAAALTNRPFLKNMAAVSLSSENRNDPEEGTMKAFATALGLAEDADEKAILAALAAKDEQTTKDAEAAKTAAEEAKTALEAAQKELADLNATATDGDKKVAELEKQVAGLVKSTHETKRESVISAAIKGDDKGAKMLPAEREAMVILYDAAGHDAVVALLDARQPIPLNKGKGSGGDGPELDGSVTAKVDGTDVPIDPETIELNAKVQAHLRSLKLDREPTQDDYLRAVQAVTSATA